MSFTLELIGADKLRAGLARGKGATKTEAEAAVKAAATAVEGIMRPLEPRKTGQLQSSTTVQQSGLSASIGPTVKYALFAHEGRRPGKMPPASSGLPFLVRRAIGRRGTKGKPWIPQTMARAEPAIQKAFAQWGIKVARVILGG